MEIYTFIGLNGAIGRCGVDIFPESKTVMLTELDDNPGTSITNFSEQLATAVREKFILHTYPWGMDEIIWIEKYPKESTDQIKDTYDRVIYTVVCNTNPEGIKLAYVLPRWSPSTWRPEYERKTFEF